MALVSFIVPCFNYGRYLPDCLDSILGQAGNWDLEVVVIDDASTDDTQAVLARYGGETRVRVATHAVNAGHIGTVTEGLLAVKGEFVSRIDPDDRLRPGYLNATIPLLQARPEVGLVYGDVALIDEHGRVTQQSCDTQHGGRDYQGNEFVALLAHNFICAPSVIARREAWLEALPVPAGLAFNDWHFTTMMARKRQFYFVGRVLADYRVHGANLHSQIHRNRAEETSVFRLLERYYSETEADPVLETEKRAARDTIYARRYLEFGDKYFGHGMSEDARRCYLAAIRHRKALLLQPALARRLLGTLIGLRAYGSLKRRLGAGESRDR